MVQVVAPHVEETGTANTTLSFTLSAVTTNNRLFSAVMAVGDTCDYTAKDGSGSWENGTGTYTATNTLTRTTIEASSSGGGAVTFSGTVTITLTQNQHSIAPYPKQLVAVTGARTISASDARSLLLPSDATGVTYTLPDIGLGAEIDIVQGGAGQITFAVSGAGLLQSVASHTKTASQYARVKALQMPYQTATTGGSMQYLVNWNPSTQFTNAAAAASASAAGTGAFRIAFCGDSTTFGIGSNGTSGNERATSAPTFAASNLATYSGSLVGTQTAYCGGTNIFNDTRLTALGGSANISGLVLFGGSGIALGSTADTATFSFGSAVFDRIRILSLDGNWTMQVTLDGTVLSPTIAGTSTNSEVAHTINVTRGTHSSIVVGLTNSNTMFLASVEVWDSTQAGLVQILNGGIGGTEANLIASATTGATYVNGLLTEAPNLVFLDWGINEMNNGDTTASQYQTNLTTGVTNLKAAGIDVFLVFPQDCSSTGYQSQRAAFLTAAKAVATAQDVPLIDLYDYFGARSTWPSTWAFDNLHGTAIFYNLVGQLYAQIIAVGVGRGTTAAQSNIATLQGSAGTPTSVPVWHISGDTA